MAYTIKAGLAPRQERMAGLADPNGACVMITGVVGTVAAVGLIIGGIVLGSEGHTALATLMFLVPLLIAVWGWRLRVAYKRYAFREYWRSNSVNATTIWRSLNKDNQAIALPLVQWIYNHSWQQDSTGAHIYTTEINKRLRLLTQIQEEQARQERAIASSDSGDLESVRQYLTYMTEARKQLEQFNS